jgi:hypothetical protein
MDALNLTIRLNKLHCYDESDGPGDAEPYLWTVFFKVDGDTVTVTEKLGLQGTATVVGTSGNQGNLKNTNVSAGENVAIPAAIGKYHTVLRPIPLLKPVLGTTHVGGTRRQNN